MATSTVEDYLKAILIQEQRGEPGELVTMGQIAAALGVSPGSVTAMVKTLARDGRLQYARYSGVRLTDAGRQLAIHVLRRHRLIELFLVDVLGLDWSEVHEEAERLEHVMSDKVIARIDALLGHPRTDPHGDPIPDAHGRFRDLDDLINLAECPAGTTSRLARVGDQDEAFLRFVEQHGLKPGAQVVVEACHAEAHAMTVKAAGFPAVTLGREAATKLWLAAVAPGP